MITTNEEVLEALENVNWVEVIPVISTFHLSQNTFDSLIEHGSSVDWGRCVPYDTGAFLHFLRGYGPGDFEGVPDDLKVLMQWASERGVDWVRLDTAADLVEGLLSYEWK